jgi:hypothetical protein
MTMTPAMIPIINAQLVGGSSTGGFSTGGFSTGGFSTGGTATTVKLALNPTAVTL